MFAAVTPPCPMRSRRIGSPARRTTRHPEIVRPPSHARPGGFRPSPEPGRQKKKLESASNHHRPCCGSHAKTPESRDQKGERHDSCRNRREFGPEEAMPRVVDGPENRQPGREDHPDHLDAGESCREKAGLNGEARKEPGNPEGRRWSQHESRESEDGGDRQEESPARLAKRLLLLG